MKNFISTIYRFLFQKEYKWSKCKLYFTYLNISNHNCINICNSFFNRSKILIIGKRNYLQVNATVKKSTIHIEGYGNTLVIEKNVNLNSINLYIIGNNCSISIGHNTFFHSGFIYAGGDSNSIIIGSDCLFAHDIDIMGADSHQIIENGKEINHSQNINIKDHVWIAAHVSILKGVTIGENAVIGARSVVTKNVNSNSLNVGVPCKELKKNISWSIERNKM